MILNEDFKFRDDLYEEEKTLPIELLSEPYKGIVLRYNQVAVKEQVDGTAKMQFDYDLLEMGSHIETALRKDQKFTEYAGLVLNAMILEILEEGKQDNGQDEILRRTSD